MKKRNVITAVVIGLTLMGCQSASFNQSMPLGNAYFTYANQLEAGKALRWERILKDLSDYSFVDEEPMTGESSRLQMFSHGGEMLAVHQYAEDESSIEFIDYYVRGEDDERSLSLSIGLEGYEFMLMVEDSNLYAQAVKVVEPEPSELSQIYQEVSAAIFNEESYTVEALQARLGLEPSAVDDEIEELDDSSTIMTTRYAFQTLTDGETMAVQTIKGSNQISRVGYHITMDRYFWKFTENDDFQLTKSPVVGRVYGDMPDLKTQETLNRLLFNE